MASKDLKLLVEELASPFLDDVPSSRTLNLPHGRMDSCHGDRTGLLPSDELPSFQAAV